MQEKLIQNKSQISEHLSTLRDLLDAVVEQSLKPDLDLLSNIGNLQLRWESRSLFICN